MDPVTCCTRLNPGPGGSGNAMVVVLEGGGGVWRYVQFNGYGLNQGRVKDFCKSFMKFESPV